ncbi:pyridoxamine 5'-phosphate oxidase family protein [Alkalicoccobacillus murimartini]|uniref:Pyridoxamine 5'-phosphate oxidase N-terminal domain-containing protein n=1 Tax=Alkalicoccobacillus murimartini TaxID=171685 RepID=A0ABT9YCX3_9BACI|nr:pyridoxamine 5'-phosphate oxidase family protein [Alkalicoccobacillus murimartini]MDQ0205705.1 hypothetical protein [Alkalicoccobacillus murimartini]
MRMIQENKSSRSLLQDILTRPLFAHLSTMDEGGPRESPLWFYWDGEFIWMLGSYQTNSFPKRIEAEPRCAIGIVDFKVETGLVHHVGLRGKAHLEPQYENLVKRLLSKYMGEVERWDPRFHAVLGDKDWIFVKFSPETVVVRDQSYSLQ